MYKKLTMILLLLFVSTITLAQKREEIFVNQKVEIAKIAEKYATKYSFIYSLEVSNNEFVRWNTSGINLKLISKLKILDRKNDYNYHKNILAQLLADLGVNKGMAEMKLEEFRKSDEVQIDKLHDTAIVIYKTKALNLKGEPKQLDTIIVKIFIHYSQTNQPLRN